MTEKLDRDASLSDVIHEAIRSEVLDLHTALPARVESYDPATQTATVVAELQRQFRMADDSLEPVTIPPISGVPVLFPRAGGYSVTFPVETGDPCLLVFAERDISGWMIQGGEGVPPSARTHQYADAVALLGLFPSSDPIAPAPSATALQLRSDDGATQIEIGPAGIKLETGAVIELDGTGNVILGSGAQLTLDGGTLLNLVSSAVANLIATGQLNLTGAGVALAANGPAGVTVAPAAGPFTVTATGAITLTRGANELLDVLSTALAAIASSTAGGDPLSNAAAISAAQALIDTIRTP